MQTDFLRGRFNKTKVKTRAGVVASKTLQMNISGSLRN